MLTLLTLWMSWVPASQAEESVSLVHLDDPRVELLGRVDLTDPAAAQLSWPATGFAVTFEGGGLAVHVEEWSEGGPAHTNHYAVVLDDGPARDLALEPGVHRVELAAGLAPGPHRLTFVKRTEAMVGTGVVHGLELGAETRLLRPPPGPFRRLEVIGDGVTCGYGAAVAADPPPAGFTAANEDVLLSYAWITARTLDAAVSTICYSGRGLLRSYDGGDGDQLPELWDRTLPHTVDSTWDFDRYQPQVVVLQVGGEDLATGRPPRRLFRWALGGLITEVRDAYPEAWILLVRSPALTEAWPVGGWGPRWVDTRLAEQVSAAAARGDDRVVIVELPSPQPPHGEDYQPSAASHAALARVLVDAIRQLTGW